METILSDYRAFLNEEKRMSQNSIVAYIRDIKEFSSFLKERDINKCNEAKNIDVLAYVMDLKVQGRSKSTINRKIASVRTFYQYLVGIGKMSSNPTETVKAPKVEKKTIEFLTLEDINLLMELPDKTDKGIRDRAILELLYATGIRASELIDMKISDVNIRMGFVQCGGMHSKARVIPMGRMCRSCMEEYIIDVREHYLKGNEEQTLFLNYAGKPITRQGLWKILKEYSSKGNLSVQLTPQVLRNSFAVHMLQNGADIKSLQELMGHEDISATQAYLAVTKNRIKDVYDKSHPRA